MRFVGSTAGIAARVCLALIAVAVGPGPRADPAEAGFVLRSARGDRLTVGGYLHLDGRAFLGPGSTAYVDQILFRRVRPLLEGTIRSHFDFRLLPDFAGGKVVLYDAYVDVRYVSWLKVRLGKFKEPISLERMQGSNALVFLERAFPITLAPNRNLGAELFGEVAGLLTYELGIFNGTVNNSTNAADSDTSGRKEAAARLFLRPFARTPWGCLTGLGLGASASWSQPRGTPTTPRLGAVVSPGQSTIFGYAAPATGPTYANTTVADGDHVRWDLQGYYTWGPAGVHSEYIHESQRLARNSVVHHAVNSALEATGSLVVTGEKATYGTIAPLHPFDPLEGRWGALELTARYQQIRLDTLLFDSGFADATTSVRGARAWGVGMNWYLDRAFRVMIDFDRTLYSGGAAGHDRLPEQILAVRAQTLF